MQLMIAHILQEHYMKSHKKQEHDPANDRTLFVRELTLDSMRYYLNHSNTVDGLKTKAISNKTKT